MYLQRLDLQGFKSFASKTTLTFDRGITCIVGPNGSGKSNVADALRWVQGEQSLKLLRGKKSEDVIFAGSRKKGQLGFAEVTVVLNNEDGAAPIDYTEVAVTRRVYRSGEGEYFINQNHVRLVDVQLLLAKCNIGQRTYSVIGQGMVDAVLMATSAERKSFFDEAAGIKQFQIKREQAVQKLTITKENVQQVETLLSEIEPRLRSLTRQVRRLERRAAVETDLRILQRHAYVARLGRVTDEQKSKRRALERAEEEQRQAAAAVETAEGQLETMARGDTRVASFQQLQQALTATVQQKNALLRERAVLKGRADLEWERQGDANLVWYEKRREELDQSRAMLERHVADGRDRRKTVQGQIQERERTQTDVRRDFAKVEQELTAAETQLVTFGGIDPSELRSQLVQFRDHHERFLRKLSRARTEADLAALRTEAERLHQTFALLVERVEQYAAGTAAEHIRRLRDDLKHFVETRDTLVNELTTLRADAQIQEATTEHAQRQLAHVEEELGRIRRDLDLARLATKDRSAALKEVERLQGDFDQRIADLERQEQETQQKIDAFNAAEDTKRESTFTLQRQIKDARAVLTRHTAAVNAYRVDLARIDTHAEDLLREIRQELPEDEVRRVQAFDASDTLPEDLRDVPLDAGIERLKHQLELIGGIDPEIHREHTETEERYTFLRTQADDLTAGIGKTEQVIDDLDATIKQQFDRSFAQISEKFTEYFRILFNGGTASLHVVKEAVVPEEPVEESTGEPTEGTDAIPVAPKNAEKVITGVEITGSPPGKRVRGITMLSGGERALTSIALICAILANNPAPFVVLDEVDAALDEANSERFAAILKRLARQSQFITITHNRATMHEAKILYGITMGDDGVSKILSLKLEEAESQAFANR
ncbi:MAG: AAA family ATPase [Candidatus Kerfeldbacteria bacterium]|nr:AAA family ATPase [Candidatus Kerfeldbacteria bacterium]